jgi:hypothetical protein
MYVLINDGGLICDLKAKQKLLLNAQVIFAVKRHPVSGVHTRTVKRYDKVTQLLFGRGSF